MGIVKEGKLVFSKGYGLANLEYKIPITSTTVFNATSLSKQFVAYAIYLLEKEHRISFEDSIQKYIPDFPEYKTPIKIKNLLTHTSGLRDQWGLLSLSGWRFDDYISNEQILKLAKQQKQLNFETNTQHGYSHTNYTLLANIIEVISNQSFQDFMKEKIFTPLDMENTFYPNSTTALIENRAYSYKKEQDTFQKVKLNYENVGPTNLMTTIDDLAKWIANFSNPKIGDIDILERYNDIYYLNDQMPAIAATIGQENIIACKGQYFRNYKNLNLYSHGGSLGGFRGYIGRLPNQQFSIIMLSNDHSFSTNTTALSIIDSFFKMEEKSNKEMDTKKSDVQLPTVQLDSYEGSYYNKEVDSLFKIRLKNNQLYVIHKRFSDKVLTLQEDGRFSTLINFPSIIDFKKDESNAVVGMKISNFGVNNLYFERIK